MFLLKNIKGSIGFLLLSMHKSVLLKKVIAEEEIVSGESSVYYSFWMDQGALILSILKDKGYIKEFSFRVLGYDLYDERRAGGYMPFRYFNFKHTKNIFCISRDGLNYLRQKKLFPEKLSLNYLSVFDNGINPFSPVKDEITLVSCSNLIPLKRVHLIIDILKQVKANVKWIHFGDGVLKNELIAKANVLPSTVKFEFRGQTSNSEILAYYRKNEVTLFIQLSETEGGAPVSMQEAASFGIPLIGTNAGGIPDIVTTETGLLVDIDFKIDEIAEFIDKFTLSAMNTVEYRESVRAFWQRKFEAEKNYNQLIDML